jgi:hypothetical protein
MSEKKPTRNDNSISEEVVGNMRENSSRSIDEIPKAPASEVQELSELQKEAAEISNNIVIAAAAENHKEPATGPGADATVPKQVVTYSDEITENFKSLTGLYSRLAMDAVELTRQNSGLYGAAIDAFNSHNLNLLNTWISYWKYPFQQQ